MFVENYYRHLDKNLSFSKQQGSDFAKDIAGDFNPLHDIDNKRFCVPGDLLFAVILSQFGVSQSMTFDFQGMVSGGELLCCKEQNNLIMMEDESQKSYLKVTREGEATNNLTFTEALIKNYVAFSGETFPDILVKLMEKEGVMINPVKPMVIYEKMQLEFSKFSDCAPEVVLSTSTLNVNGKRGLATMEFDLRANRESIGRGKKQMILSGLMSYDQEKTDSLIKYYTQRKASYKQQNKLV